MESPEAAPSLGRRFVLVVLLVAVLPLGVIGLWVTRSSARSGRTLLQSQLEVQLAQSKRDVEQRWRILRGELLTLGENEPMRLLLLDSATTSARVPPFVQNAFAQTTGFDHVVIRDRRGRARVTLARAADLMVTERRADARDGQGISVRLHITDLATDDTIGSIDASVRVAALLPVATAMADPAGPLTAAFAGSSGSIVPPGAEPTLFENENVTWGEHHWLTVRDTIMEPPLVLAVAGALDPYLEPFERSAARGAAVLAVGAMVIIVVVGLLTRRMTRNVERQMAQREALATVGEFSSELAHEVRNPLTSVRLDLQQVEEAADDPDAVRRIVPRVLRQIDRLDRAVSGALRVARGGSIEPKRLDLRDVLEAARRGAEAEFRQRGARVRVDVNGEPLPVDGDAGALEQLFLNLLINAAQSLSASGEARVAATRSNGDVEVTIADTGVGMTTAELKDVEQPFRTTRRDGTGLGLKIARRIVASHRGELVMTSSKGVGTTVRVRLPAG